MIKASGLRFLFVESTPLLGLQDHDERQHEPHRGCEFSGAALGRGEAAGAGSQGQRCHQSPARSWRLIHPEEADCGSPLETALRLPLEERYLAAPSTEERARLANWKYLQNGNQLFCS